MRAKWGRFFRHFEQKKLSFDDFLRAKERDPEKKEPENSGLRLTQDSESESIKSVNLIEKLDLRRLRSRFDIILQIGFALSLCSHISLFFVLFLWKDQEKSIKEGPRLHS